MSARGFLAALAFAPLSVAALALAGCAPGVQPLLDEYNALFGSVTERGQEGVETDDSWLEDYYEPYEVDGFILPVPPHSSDWDWDMVADPGHPEDKMPEGFKIDEHVKDNGHLVIKSLKDAKFEPGNYIITCTVTVNGRKRDATCKVLIRSEESLKDGVRGGQP